MGADGCGRVSKHVGVESKNITRIKTPEPSIQPTVKTQKQPTTRSMLMENAKIRKMETRIQGQGETHSLEALYKQNAHKESKKNHTHSHYTTHLTTCQNTETTNNQNLIH